MELRGAGELLGTKQSGLPEFRVGNLVRDIKILEDRAQRGRALFDQARKISRHEEDD